MATDSTVGKVVQRLGGMVHSPALVRKGGAMREEAPREGGLDENAPSAN